MKAAIFDMDGVLVDSVEAYADAFCTEFGKMGLKVERDAIRKMVGMTPLAITTIILDENSVDYDANEFVGRMSREFRRIGKKEIKVLPYVPAVLQKLEIMKARKAIASGTTPELIEFTLQSAGIRKYFKEIVSGSEVERGKPEPDIFLLAAKKLGEKPKNCIVFEDSVHGIEAARKAGMQAIGIATGPYSIERLGKKGILAVNNFGELMPKLEGIFLEEI